ncbi:hypothetical protein E2C01_050890 [Portunus trituberculatus]|uniref:Uncharacterized protein n=1 Tax=Portunus trituberculatus TaxID=210409 RepID=A0A5B7GHN7_PORTR|nr:hypothetical protein [Portunus trituberculatus]
MKGAPLAKTRKIFLLHLVSEKLVQRDKSRDHGDGDGEEGEKPAKSNKILTKKAHLSAGSLKEK